MDKRTRVAIALRGDWPTPWNELPEDAQRRWLVRADRVLAAIEQDKRMNAPPSDGKIGPLALTAAIAAAVAVAAPLAMKWEGYAPKQYLDPAGIPTACYGETEKLKADPSYIYSKTECATLLRARMQRDYGPRIAACLPEVIHNRFIFGALIDASYNAGWAAVCRSPMAANIRAGQLGAACDRLPTWYVTAQKRVNGKRVGKPFLLKGLVNRRKDERLVCLKGVGA